MTAAASAKPDGPIEHSTTSSAAPSVISSASAWWILIAGVAGLIASATLTIEKIELLLNPAYVPSCNLNPIVSCGSVMTTPQASAFGFPNSLIGIAAFAVVTVTGVLAVAKVPLPRWYWIGITLGTLVATGFVHWLIVQSLYRIGALCPYCMVVWVATDLVACGGRLDRIRAKAVTAAAESSCGNSTIGGGQSPRSGSPPSFC